MTVSKRIFLSPPKIEDEDIARVSSALKSGWAAPIGPDLDLFEHNIAKVTNRNYAVGLSSGTAALHLSLLALGIGVGDDVLVPTLTFAATVNAIKYVGANPILVDVSNENWCIDESLLRAYFLSDLKKPKAVLSVDLFGRMPNYPMIQSLCDEFGAYLICDAAESLGSTLNGNPAGSFGDCAIFSFNGNKIVTSSGGGMFVSNNADLAEKVRYLATQARSKFHWYEHEEIGYNYRLSNILAALGDSQLERLNSKVEKKTRIRESYIENFQKFPSIVIIEDYPQLSSNAWLTNIRFDSKSLPGARDLVFNALNSMEIESRFVWKPMHTQPVFKGESTHLQGISEKIYAESLCLPSGEGLAISDVDRITSVILKALESN